MSKIKLWPQLEFLDDLEDALDEQDQKRARELRTRKNDETRMNKGRKRGHKKGPDD